MWDGSFVANVAISRPRRAPDVVIASTPSLGGAVLGARFAQRYRVPFGVVIQDLVGQAKEKLGEVTGNEDLQAEGLADQAKADVKDAG